MEQEFYIRFLEPIIDLMTTLVNKTLGFLPNILGAIVLLIIGAVISKYASKGVSKLLEALINNKFSKKVGIKEFTEKIGFKHNIATIIGKLTYWVIFLLFVIISLETLELRTVSNSITELFLFLPRVIAAILIIMVGLVISRLASDAVKNFATSAKFVYAEMLGTICFILMMVFMVLIAINEIGIDISILTNNLTVIVTGIVVAGAISVGIGGKRIAENILISGYVRKNFNVGDKIKVDETTGVIESINAISIEVKSGNDLVVIPLSRFVTGNVTKTQ